MSKLIEAAVEFLSRKTSSSLNKDNHLKEEKDQEEDTSVTKRVSQKHGHVWHVGSEGSHHIYAQVVPSSGHMKYFHHDSSTGKTTNLGTHGKRATDTTPTDMSSNAEDRGIKISRRLDSKIADYHDSE